MDVREIKAMMGELAPVIREYVSRETGPLLGRIETLEAAIAEPTDGEQGPPGRDGAPGPQGEPGLPGADGKDGIGLASALIDRDGELVITTTDGGIAKLGRVNGKDGEAGKPGLDGLGFDDLNVTHDGERGFTLVFAKGEQRKEFAFALPVLIYRGVFREGLDYVRGDTVTWDNSGWHCNKPTRDKPGHSDHWSLVARRGSDGRQGKTGKDGADGKPGVPGRDGRTWS